MKVLHVSTAKTWRGGEQQLAYLMEELQSQKIEQHIVCLKNSRIDAKAAELGISRSYAKKQTSLSLRFALKIKLTCDQERISIIHTHDAHAHTFAVWAAQLFGNRVPIIVSRRVDFPIKRNWLSQLKYNHQMVKKIICVSDAVKHIAAENLPLNTQEKLATVYSGIDLKKFDFEPSNKLKEAFNIPASHALIGNVSALAPHKDYFTFLDTVKVFFQKHPTTEATFLIIGDGLLKDQLEQYAASLNVNKHVVFTGFRSDVTAILKELDVFLITSETEGLGTTIIDAMACNVPVVATRAGGIPELVIHEKTGLSSNVKNAVDLAENCHRILVDEALRSQLVSNAANHVKGFAKEVTASLTLNYYREVLRQHKGNS